MASSIGSSFVYRDSLTIRPFSDLKRYEKVSVLGSGGFGKVYLLRLRDTEENQKENKENRSDEEQYAGKIQCFDGGPSLNRREAAIMTKLANPEMKHVVQLLDYFEGKNQSVTLMEVLTGGELFKYISSNEYRLTEAKCRHFAREILYAVKFIHDSRIIHLDLKPENIILVPSQQGTERLKLIDFGLARDLKDKDQISINLCGTLEFISPEVLRCSHATFASDMWGIGVIFYMMLSGGLSPFFDGTVYGTERAINRGRFVNGGFAHPNFNDISKSAIDCMSNLLKLDPKLRLSAAECLEHPWMTTTYVDTLRNLETAYLRKYLARRRWRRWFNAIVALNRMIRITSIGKSRKTSADLLTEDMLGDYGELGFFV